MEIASAVWPCTSNLRTANRPLLFELERDKTAPGTGMMKKKKEVAMVT